jgi:ABC-type Fe3+/spermidine/putrescine transport system ATPase subunit
LKQKGKTVTCLTQGLGNMDVGTDKTCGDKATIAIRPEKLKIGITEPKGAGLIKTRATIRDVAYYGDTSHVVADASDGLHLEINVQNNSRTGGSGVERGQKVWVHFDPKDALLLTE